MPVIECMRGAGSSRHLAKMWVDHLGALRELRGDRAIAEVAKDLGVSQTLAHYMESGLPFSPEMAERLGAAYGTSVESLKRKLGMQRLEVAKG